MWKYDLCLVPYRGIFEGFGGLKGVVNAARDGKGAEHEITFRNSGTAVPGDAEPEIKVSLRAPFLL